jgi:galactonate dehydratase
MKITEVKVWLVEGVKYNWTLLKVYTDTGHTGVGEATNWPGSPIIEAAARHVGERVIGLDPMRTDFIWTKLYRDLNWIGPFGASMCAISGLDMALLDLKGKVLGVPAYQLLGGAFRTSIDSMRTTGSPAAATRRRTTRAQAAVVKAAGFGGLKFDPFAHTNYLYGTDLNTNLALTPAMQDRAVEVTKAVRDAVGPEMDMMIETHAMMNGQMAVKMAERLAPFGMTWYEEPAGPENAATLRALRERLPGNVSICVGERHYTRHNSARFLKTTSATSSCPTSRAAAVLRK